MKTFVRPRKRLGQHFLKNESDAQRIVDSLQIKAGDDILEIGPGEGVLTQFLLASEAKSITCVELDERLIPWLKARFESDRRFRIIHADFLKWPGPEANGILYRVIGNLPYYITSPILFRLLTFRPVIRDVTVMVQKEFGQRLISEPGSKNYGIPSVLFQLYAAVEKKMILQREAFVPPPKVESMVISIQFFKKPVVPIQDPQHLRQLLKTVFGQRRKMLRNTMKSLVKEDRQLEQLDVDLTRRPEELSPETFVALSHKLIELEML